jgi:Na+/proline symporter
MASTLTGILLIAVPVIVFQLEYPETPLDRKICTLLGGIGGALMASRCNKNALGFRWAAGMFGGAITSNLAYYGSVQWFMLVDGPSVNIFIIFFCSIPGLIVYAIISRVSDRTFPDYIPIPSSHSEHKQAPSGPVTIHTPLLGHRV